MTIFIDVVGIGVIIPVVPFYVRSFGATDAIVTLLMAVFSLLSFVSAPMLGSLSDRLGRRPVLVASIISTSIGWFIFAWAPSIIWLFIGRIIDGAAAGNITIAQSLLADIAKDEKERTVNMGLFGAMFGIGLIIGPIIGGVLGYINHSLPFWFVGILAAVNAILAYFFLPETHTEKHHDKKISINPFRPIWDGFRNMEMRKVFLIWFLFGIGTAIYFGTFSIFASSVLGYNARAIGIIFGFLGVLMLINQVTLLKHVWLKYFKERRLAEVMLIMYAIGMLFVSIPTILALVIGLVLLTIGQGNLRTVFSSMIAGFNPNKRGEYLGISTSIMSLALVIGPLITTATFNWNPHIPFVIASVIVMAGYFLLKESKISHMYHK